TACAWVRLEGPVPSRHRTELGLIAQSYRAFSAPLPSISWVSPCIAAAGTRIDFAAHRQSLFFGQPMVIAQKSGAAICALMRRHTTTRRGAVAAAYIQQRRPVPHVSGQINKWPSS